MQIEYWDPTDPTRKMSCSGPDASGLCRKPRPGGVAACAGCVARIGVGVATGFSWKVESDAEVCFVSASRPGLAVSS